MIDYLAEQLAQAQTAKPWWFIIAFSALLLVTLPGIFLLVNNVEASLENVLPSNVESVSTMNDARTQYSADMLHVVIYASGAVTDVQQAQAYADEVASRIQQAPLVVTAQSTFTEHTLSADKQLAVIDVQANTGTQTQQITRVIEDIQRAIDASQANNPGVETQITGFAAIDQATFNTIMSDFLKITGLAMLLILGVVYSLFRRVRSTLIPIVAVFAALITTMGLTGYLGITITVVTMVAAAMILGLGIDFGIHIIHSYTQYRESKTPVAAMQLTVHELFRAQLGASLTTSAGFLALGLGVLPAMADLGLVLALGIFFTFLSSVGLLPPLLLLTESTTQPNN